LKECEEARNGDSGLRKSLDFRFASQMDDVKDVADFSSKDEEGMEELSRQNV